MRKILFSFILFTIAFVATSYGQDTLPNISVKNVKGKIIVSWKNAYGASISAINVQRSYDSLKHFSTFNSVLNPSAPENGAVDANPYNDSMFYRVFVAFETGDYLFSKAYRPTVNNDQTVKTTQPANTIKMPAGAITAPKATEETSKYFTESNQAKETPVKHLAPLFSTATKSISVGKDNNVILNVSETITHKYFIRFFDENNRQVFKVDKIPDPFLIIDKVNFRHAGWFYYKLYKDGLLIENNSFYIPKDARIINGD